MKRAGSHFCGALAINPPGPGSVNCFSINVEPCAHIKEHLLDLFGNSAIGARAKVQQQIAVLADDINELMNDEFRRLESIILYIAPRAIADRGIRLPVERTNVAELSSL